MENHAAPRGVTFLSDSIIIAEQTAKEVLVLPQEMSNSVSPAEPEV
jgi:hypothetical protein